MDLRDLGGGRKACVPENERGATADGDEAARILVDAVEALKNGETTEDPLLRVYAERHLEKKAEHRRESTVARDEQSLRIALSYFGEEVRLSEIGVAKLSDFVTWRRRQPGVREGTTISDRTILNDLHALSSLYKRAVAEGKASENPVRRLPEKPSIGSDERVWLEPGEAARFLAAAAKLDADPHPRTVPYLRPVFAVPLLTSARKSEALGLEARDVDFERSVVHIRPNRWRKLKTRYSKRSVPLWPQLRKILAEHVERFDLSEGLLFPAPDGAMLSDLRGSIAAILEEAKIEKRVTFTTLRHTYASTRIQTLDNGAPVSLYTVAREMGHQGVNQIEKTYGHLQSTRHRSPVVEYVEAEVVEIDQARRAG